MVGQVHMCIKHKKKFNTKFQHTNQIEHLPEKNKIKKTLSLSRQVCVRPVRGYRERDFSREKLVRKMVNLRLIFKVIFSNLMNYVEIRVLSENLE